jgi:hypothetical protein
MTKQPQQNGNFFADILMPFVVAGIFVATVGRILPFYEEE